MLPQFYRFVIVNNSGQTVTFDVAGGRISLRMWGIGIHPTTGLAVYTELAESEDDLGFTAGQTLANGSELVGDNEIDNTTTKYIGLQVQIRVLHDEGAAADGTFDLYISVGDATGELETDQSGYAGAVQAPLQRVGGMTWSDALANDNVVLSNMITL